MDGKGDPRSIQHKLILKFLIFKQVTMYILVPIWWKEFGKTLKLHKYDNNSYVMLQFLKYLS